MMNSIINRFYRESVEVRDVVSHGAFGEIEVSEEIDLDVEKFARLIIEECVRIIDPTDLRIPISEEVTLYKAIDKIYEHFRGM